VLRLGVHRNRALSVRRFLVGVVMRQNGPVQLIGQSAAIVDLREEIVRIARSDAKVLITGESGAGKEVVARAINDASTRARSFVPVNCGGIPETLLESELFGHVKGSFTGAYRDKPGKLEMADNGTIFMDEIGEMTLRMQGLLLRFLETGEIQKVGSERMVKATNVRIMAATNRDLRDLIVQGLFREDLYYRINVIHLIVPPLRERREDIPLLLEFFLDRHLQPGASGATNAGGNGQLAERTGVGGNGQATGQPGAGSIAPANGPATDQAAGAAGGPLASPSVPRPNGGHHSPVRSISPEALEVLCEYHWPGNVRQVENIVERLIVTGHHEVVQVSDLPSEIRSENGGRGGRERRKTVADELFQRLVTERESFWKSVYPLYMNREITRSNVRELVHKGLEEARGNYKIVLKLFNMESKEYKRFLNFLRKHECQLPFKEYR
jgi:transcriptional regulator with PAS, ATPase and Fis domain